jgi:SAM-dependent methyltransferase
LERVKAMISDYSGIDILDLMDIAGKNYNRFLTNSIVKHSNKVRKMLDFGAGTGTFARRLRDRDVDVHCVEPDIHLRRQLSEAGFRVFESLDETPFASFDFVYLLNVLEHIENDLQAMAAIKERLKPGGKVLVYVPAFQFLYSAMDRKIGHIRRYTVGSLVSVICQAGLQVEFSRYADSLGFFAAMLYLRFGSKKGDLSRFPLLLYDRFLFPLSLLLDLIFCRLFGKNVILLAKRMGK